MINARKIELIEHARLAHQLCALERRVARGGRDSIDHSVGGHDDCANAVAGALTQLDADHAPQLVRLSDVTDNGQGAPLPTRCNVVSATVVTVGSNIAVVYAASRRYLAPLYVCDVWAGPYYGGFFRDLAARLDELARQCGSPSLYYGWKPKVFVAADFIPYLVLPDTAPPPGTLLDFEPVKIPPWFDLDRGKIAASTAMAGKEAKKVVFCLPTVERMQSTEIAAAMAFKAGAPIETALEAALVVTVCFKYDLTQTAPPKKKSWAV